ncbi:hypothetical protein AALD01_20385 [Oscillospiraceae bacterium 21-37]
MTVNRQQAAKKRRFGAFVAICEEQQFPSQWSARSCKIMEEYPIQNGSKESVEKQAAG